MNAPIRAISIATTVVWILLISVLVISAYSIAGLGIVLFPPTIPSVENGTVIISMPIQINNGGFMDLNEINITTVVNDNESSEMSRSSTFLSSLPKYSNGSVFHNITLNSKVFPRKMNQYLFSDSNFTILLYGGLNIAGVLPTIISTNFSFPWGAPFFDFGLEKPQITPANNTHTQAIVPFNFTNHAKFEVIGNLSVSAYDSAGVLRGVTQNHIEVSSGRFYQDTFVFLISINESLNLSFENGYFDISFSGDLGDFGPWRIPYD